jgi:hypothetical protein
MKSLLRNVLIISVLSFGQSFSQINNYQKFFGEFHDSVSKSDFIIIRKFEAKNDSVSQIKFLAVDINKLTSKILSDIDVDEKSLNQVLQKHPLSAYSQLMRFSSENNSGKLFNAGITNIPSDSCYFLTTDLCPSKNDFEKEFYPSLQKLTNTPDSLAFPVGIAISGYWILTNRNNLKWLIQEEKRGKISIIWINHSYTHKYYEDQPHRKNFMLHQTNNTANEILKTEQLMIKSGIVPSVFFRFPGLISDTTLYKEVSGFGLAILGSDSWIAFNQKPTKGSIVLLHGNGNEPEGIEMFGKWLKINKKALFPGDICIGLTEYLKNYNNGDNSNSIPRQQ